MKFWFQVMFKFSKSNQVHPYFIAHLKPLINKQTKRILLITKLPLLYTVVSTFYMAFSVSKPKSKVSKVQTKPTVVPWISMLHPFIQDSAFIRDDKEVFLYSLKAIPQVIVKISIRPHTSHLPTKTGSGSGKALLVNSLDQQFFKCWVVELFCA